ncbi:hypothetical protein TWF225_002680 [Orbilia oligospora]|uniref:Uncharacterized protein n=2 Tax=Orbilia oligospora TaxID=2813651 RepID=A0A7C8K9R8_ORBOL|nr:hypothetical protein TWF225_002680 [Orbilia oligospora]KAF3165096.1 hypothetical protein TWF751_009460 [Orbilia oligospora]KAF3239176.1 hypothetical protein TWF217_001360 [Orbilia oligospora]KAF3262750.1 hypothetical protein TWF128_002491 [Orbilia oligospora]TGJ69548.1 hypothetical protein EYR41_005578 [Orbilia oligospora]
MAGSRNHASPMDWSYDNHTGPTDPSSPFSRQNIERQMQGGPPRKRHYGETAVTPIKDRQFDMTTPSSKPFFFTPFQNPLDSSAFKTARDLRSPSVNSDAEDSPAPNVAGMDSMMTDDTPTKTPMPMPLVVTKKGEESDPDTRPDATIKKQQGAKGLFGNFGFLPPKKTSKGEKKAHKFSDKAAKKVERRRRKQGSGQNVFWAHPGDSYDSEDSDSPFAPATNKRRSQRTWAETHRDIPQVLSQYLQLTINILIASVVMYFVYLVWSTIQKDVNKKIDDYTAIAQLKVAACNAKLVENRCQPDLMVPAMAEQCMEWRACAEMDPYNTGRSQVSAETFAQIINGFVEHISYKSMVFCLALAFGCIFFSNFAFGFFRAKVGGHPAPVLAAAAPRLVYGGAAGVVHQIHSYPATGTAIFATPAPGGKSKKGKSHGNDDNIKQTPFFTARKAVRPQDDEDDDDYDGDEYDGYSQTPTVSRRRVLF